MEVRGLTFCNGQHAILYFGHMLLTEDGLGLCKEDALGLRSHVRSTVMFSCCVP